MGTFEYKRIFVQSLNFAYFYIVMRGSCYIISGLFLTFILGTLVEAQLPAPRLDSIFPMGCKAGGSVDITLKGADLTDDGQLFFNSSALAFCFAINKSSSDGSKPQISLILSF